jgi:membrane-bound metal-dependent hydrolase YbcI (DUF457 family)
LENAAHTLCGLALARAGADRLSPLATVAVVVGANLPDIDVLGYPFGGQPYYLCHHRGLTHSLLGLGIESLLLASVIALCALATRRVLSRAGPPLRFRGLWLAAGIGLLSHLVLDSLNTYGVRPFLPFSEARFYGDIAFIVDPWLWLGFGFAACLGAPRPALITPPSSDPQADLAAVEAALAEEDTSALDAGLEGVLARAEPVLAAPDARARAWEALARVGWGIGIFLGAAILFTHDRAPAGVGWLWTIPFLAVLSARHFRLVPDAQRQRFAWAGLAAVTVYLAVLGGLQRVADARARAEITRHAGASVDVSTTHPAPATPWRFHAVVATRETVFQASVDLLGEVEIDPGSLPRHLDHPGLATVAGTREHYAWRSFARIPFVAQLSHPGSPLRLILGDARYVPFPQQAWCNLVASPPTDPQPTDREQ